MGVTKRYNTENLSAIHFKRQDLFGLLVFKTVANNPGGPKIKRLSTSTKGVSRESFCKQFILSTIEECDPKYRPVVNEEEIYELLTNIWNAPHDLNTTEDR